MNNMLREEVVREWNNLAQRIAKEKQFTVFLGDKFHDFVGNFTNPDPLATKTKIENHLSYWVGYDYLTKLQASKNEVADKAEEINDSSLSHLQFAYFNAVNAFLALTRGWWEEKNAGGPTIEEISD